MIPGVNIVNGKTSVASVNGARGSGLYEEEPLTKLLGSKEQLDWL